MKNKDKSKLGAYVVIPDVETDDTIDKKTLENSSFGIIKK